VALASLYYFILYTSLFTKQVAKNNKTNKYSNLNKNNENLTTRTLCSGLMLAFVVLDLFSSVVAKRLAGKNVSELCPIRHGIDHFRDRNDLFCAEWDVKP